MKTIRVWMRGRTPLPSAYRREAQRLAATRSNLLSAAHGPRQVLRVTGGRGGGASKNQRWSRTNSVVSALAIFKHVQCESGEGEARRGDDG